MKYKVNYNYSPLIILFMGCVDSEVVTSEGLRSQLLRVKLACDLKKQRTDQELKKG